MRRTVLRIRVACFQLKATCIQPDGRWGQGRRVPNSHCAVPSYGGRHRIIALQRCAWVRVYNDGTYVQTIGGVRRATTPSSSSPCLWCMTPPYHQHLFTCVEVDCSRIKLSSILFHSNTRGLKLIHYNILEETQQSSGELPQYTTITEYAEAKIRHLD